MIMSASMPLPIGGRRPQPQPRLSLLLSPTNDFKSPAYENFENGNIAERRHSETSERRLRPPKPKPRRRSLLDLPLICARDSSPSEESTLDKSANSSRSSEDLLSDSSSCGKILADNLIEFNGIVRVKALPAVVYDENSNNNNFVDIYSDSEINRGSLSECNTRLCALQTDSSSVALANSKNNTSVTKNADNDALTRIAFLNDCLLSSKPESLSDNSSPLPDTVCSSDVQLPDSTFIGPFKPIKCMPYNSPRLARGPKPFGTNQDGIRRNSKASALPKALGRGTLSSSASSIDKCKDVCATSKLSGIKSSRDSNNFASRHERGAAPTMTTHLRSATYKKLEEIANRDADLSDCSSGSSNFSGSSGSPSGFRKRTGSASRNVEYRRSAAVPPQLVANLANKFNAIISQNDPVSPAVKPSAVPKPTTNSSSHARSVSASPLRNNCRLYSAVRHHKRETAEENKRPTSPLNTGSLSRKAKTSTVTKSQALTNSKDSDSDSSSKSAPSGSRRPSFVRQAVRNYEVSLCSTTSSPELQRRNSNSSRHSDTTSVSSFTSPALLKKKLAAAAEAQAQRFAADSASDKYAARSNISERPVQSAKNANKVLSATDRQIPRPTTLGKLNNDKEGSGVTRIVANPIIYKHTASNAASSNYVSPKFGVSLKKTITKTLPELSSSTTTTVATTTRILSLHRDVSSSVTKDDQRCDDDSARVVLNGCPTGEEEGVQSDKNDSVITQKITVNSDCASYLSDDKLSANSHAGKSKVPKPVDVVSSSPISRGRALFEKRSNTVSGISVADLQEAQSMVNGEKIDKKPPPLPTTQPRKIRTFGSVRVPNGTKSNHQNVGEVQQPTANNCFYLHSKLSQHSKKEDDANAPAKSFLHSDFEGKVSNSSANSIVKNGTNNTTTSCFLHAKIEKASRETLNKDIHKESNTLMSTDASSLHSSQKDKETITHTWHANTYKLESNEKTSLPGDKKLEVGKSNYVPNTSFLWRENQRPIHPLNLGSIPPPPSTAPPPIPTAAGESPASPRFANHQCNIYDDVVTPMSENGFDEPLYSEAYTSPDYHKENGSENGSIHNVVTYKISRFHREESRNSTRSDPLNYNDSDEGWVDLSDSEVDALHNPKHLSLPLNTKVRTRSRKAGCRRSGLRRSWSQSLRDLAIGGDGKEIPIDANDPRTGGEDYNDFEDFFDSDESDSTNPDHHYEALYEVVHKRTDSQESDLAGEWYRAKQSGMQSIESVEAACILEEISDSKESLPSRSSQTIDSATGDKMKQLKRNWSLTKSDIRLELSSRLNKIRVKKTSTSASDVHLETSPTQPADGKKKSWSLRNKFVRKKSGSTSPTKRSPSPKKESAHFYVQNYVTQSSTESSSDTISSSSNNAQQPPVSMQSTDLPHRQSRSSHGRQSTASDSPSHSISPSSRGRRSASGTNIIRPKTAPPAPPAYASRIRNGSSSSLDSSQAGGQAAQLKHSNSDVQDAIDRARYKSSDSSIQLDEVYIAVLRSKSDSDTESVRSGVRYADIDSSKRFGAVMVSRSNSNVSSGSEMVVIIPKSPKTRSSVASSASTSSSDTYIQMADVDPAVLRRMSDLFHEAVERRSEKFANKTSLAPIARTDSSSSEEADVYLRPNGMLSPFEDEPLYQFYNKDVFKRATQLNLLDGSDDDYEVANKPIKQIPGLPSKLSAMDLITPTEGGHRTLWGELPEVLASGILDNMTSQERTLQEAMFEVITSEASYLKSLNILVNHFMEHRLFKNEFSTDCVLSKREQHVLFSDVIPVKKISEMLLVDLEKRWQESLVISELCDIINDHAQRNFAVYVKYVSNQIYQERTLKALKENNPQFVEALRNLEANPICQNLAMHSFLMLPMQRITRLPLLVDAILNRLAYGSPEYERCEKCLGTVNKVVQECNEGARKMERLEHMMLLSRQINFRDIKAVPLISASRWLVKEGELTRLTFTESSSMLFGRRCAKQTVYVFLFTDLLVLTKKIKGEDSYHVLDHCPRNMVQVSEMNVMEHLPAKPPDGCKNLFQLTMLQNHESKTVEMIFSCPKESDRTRWIEAVTPRTSENPDEKIYEQWDCPQVQAIHTYLAQQPDELPLNESDVVNVLKKVADGWYHGERIRDGVQGWFPANHTVEIISAHVRARNLRQRYRLLQFLEEKRRNEKGAAT